MLDSCGVNGDIVTVTSWLPELGEVPGPRYLAIAEAIEADVASGRLRPGERLPTQRDLAARLDVTVGTVTRAYLEAARRGLVSGEVGRGTFVRARAEHLPHAPDAAEVDLAVNHPPPPHGAPHVAALKAALVRVAQGGLEHLLEYPPEGGSSRHREAGAAWLGRIGLEARPEQVVVCNGSQHGLTTLLATLMQPGDVLLAEALTYPGLRSVASLLHLRVQGLALDADGLRPDALEAACRTSAARVLYCLPTIHNPTSSVMPERRRREVAEIARTHGLTILEDDIHAHLPEGRPLPLAAFAPERTCYVTGTSKTLAPGLRVGFVFAPEALAERLASAVRATTWGAAPLMAEVVAEWIDDGTADAIVAARRREAAARQELARGVLSGFELQAHPFGYHLWLPLPDPWRAEAFTAHLRRRGVSVTPAEAFVAGRGTAPHAVRLCLGAPRTREELESGLQAVAETLAAEPEAGRAIV